MSYALATIWHERNRFLPAILAVAFSAVLIAVQAGLLVGLLSMMSTPVDKAAADIWVGYPGVQSVDLGLPVPASWRHRVLAQPEVREVEEVVIGYAQWAAPANEQRRTTLTEGCMIMGTRLDTRSIALAEPLRANPDLGALAEPYTVLIDRSERQRMGVTRKGDKAV